MFQDLFFRCCVYPVSLKELHLCWEGGRSGSFWLGFVQEELCVVSQDCPGSQPPLGRDIWKFCTWCSCFTVDVLLEAVAV